MNTLTETSRKLVASSRRHFVNPDEVIDWPDVVDSTSWCFSPQLSSIARTDTWGKLSEAQQREVCFWEAVNFFSLNLHGESALLEGVAARVNREEFSDISEYLRHFIDEENKHSMWFARFCRQYAKKIYPERKLRFATEVEQTEADFLFFAQIALFEELVDGFNVSMAADDMLHPVVRDIHRLHHSDESRHLQFGRKLVTEFWAQWSLQWNEVDKKRIIVSLDEYVEMTWRQFYNPSVYLDAGLSNGVALAREGWDSSAELREQMSKPCRALIDALAVS